MQISRAQKEDLPKILELQYTAYRSEAALVGNPDIPPLRQTLPQLEAEFAQGLVLKAVDESGAVIGSVRGTARDGTLCIGKLMVHPDRQGKGLGTALLREVERICPHDRYELFTSSLSERNIRLYERCGYRRFREEATADGLTMVYLEKRGASVPELDNAGEGSR